MFDQWILTMTVRLIPIFFESPDHLALCQTKGLNLTAVSSAVMIAELSVRYPLVSYFDAVLVLVFLIIFQCNSTDMFYCWVRSHLLSPLGIEQIRLAGIMASISGWLQFRTHLTCGISTLMTLVMFILFELKFAKRCQICFK